VETGVELRAGQTLAIGGLLEQRMEATNQGYPWISEVPYLGTLFRSVSHQTNEVELIVLVTPEIVDGMQPCQVPACLPGSQTTDPSDWELFFKGHLEVPNCCPEPGCQCCATPAAAGFNPAAGPTIPQNPQNPAAANQMVSNPLPPEPAYIGPIGYDVLK
jgi:pilus assembly protein CpaC